MKERCDLQQIYTCGVGGGLVPACCLELLLGALGLLLRHRSVEPARSLCCLCSRSAVTPSLAAGVWQRWCWPSSARCIARALSVVLLQARAHHLSFSCPRGRDSLKSQWAAASDQQAQRWLCSAPLSSSPCFRFRRKPQIFVPCR